MVQLLWKTTWQFLKKLKIALPYDPEIPLLRIHPKELEGRSQRHICVARVHSNIIHKSQKVEEATQVSSGWMGDKHGMECSLSLKKEGSSDTDYNMDGP